MSQNQRKTITAFYEAFSKGGVEEMLSSYHDDIVFEDPAFGQLKGEEAKAMWKNVDSAK